MSGIPGIETDSVERWITTNAEALHPPFVWTRLTGGHSNLTYLIEAGDGTRAVVRRPPLGPLQPRAHDMHREFVINSALWPTTVPVARPYSYCGDLEVTGAHFYVMGHVEGRSLATSDELRAWLPDGERQRRAAESFIDVLADLHRVDPDGIGLRDLSRADDFVGRQLASWYRSWATSAADAGYDDRRVHEVHDLLQARKPEQGQVRIVHGDYGFHNCMITDHGDIAAVLDWEVCTLGDPRFDLAYILNRWSVEGAVIAGREEITMPATFPAVDEVVERYAGRTGVDLADLDYFIALNHWRSACIVHGVYTRYMRGQKPTDGIELDRFRASIGARLDAAAVTAANLR